MAAIDATARVADGARIGDGVEIGPYCLVGPHVELKDGVRLVAGSARAVSSWCPPMSHMIATSATT